MINFGENFEVFFLSLCLSSDHDPLFHFGIIDIQIQDLRRGNHMVSE